MLVPLCGKAIDMAYLADMGHEVVGVEGVRQVKIEDRIITDLVTD